MKFIFYKDFNFCRSKGTYKKIIRLNWKILKIKLSLIR